MNFDSTEPQSNMFLRLSATFMAIVACFCIFLIPNNWEWVHYVNLSVCLTAAGLYFASSWDENECNKGWKVSFFLGMIWLFNATIHLLLVIAANLPKLE